MATYLLSPDAHAPAAAPAHRTPWLLYGSFVLAMLLAVAMTLSDPYLSALLPTSTLPPWLALAAKVLPMTYAYDGLRLGLLAGATPAQLMPQLAMLAAFGLPMAFAACAAAVSRAKREGSLDIS